MELEKPAPSRPAQASDFVRVPWTWQDMLLFFPGAAIVVLFAIAAFAAVSPTVRAGQAHPSLPSPGVSLVEEAVLDAALLGLLLALLWRRHHVGMGALGWRWPKWRWLLATPLITVFTVVLTGALSSFADWVAHSQANPQCAPLKAVFGGSLVLGIVAVAILPPVIEETIVRGFLYGWLRHQGYLLAIPLSAAIFAGMHFIPILFLPLFGVGVVLAALYELSRSIIPGVIVHGMFNLTNYLFILAGQC